MAIQTETYNLETTDRAEALEYIDYSIKLLEDAGFTIENISLTNDYDGEGVTACVSGSREYKKNE